MPGNKENTLWGCIDIFNGILRKNDMLKGIIASINIMYKSNEKEA